MEVENQNLTIKFKKEKKAVKEALHLNSKLLNALNQKKEKNKALKLQISLSDQNSDQISQYVIQSDFDPVNIDD